MHPQTDSALLAAQCSRATCFEELTAIALSELHKFPQGAEVVCGPISTGGRGSVLENLRIFSATIHALQGLGIPVFSQMPYEEKIFHFRNRWRTEDPTRVNQYYTPILLEFYHPLIQTGLIKKGWFIPGWESSTGAQWERIEFQKLGIEICDLEEGWIVAL